MATARASAPSLSVAGYEPAARSLQRWLLPPATATAILGLALLLLLTPVWVHAAIDLAGGTTPGGDRAAAHAVSDRTVADLLSGGTFDIAAPGGAAMYTADEIGHLRDVRVVLYVFLGLAAGSGLLVFVTVARAARDARLWRAVSAGGAVLIGAVAVLGVVGVLAFGPAFELFHRLLFPGGNWAFPVDSNLIRLYPYAFWQLSAAAMGALAIAGGAAVWLAGRWRAERLSQG